MKRFITFLTLIVPMLAFATAGDIDVVRLVSPDHTKVWTPPSSTATLVGRGTVDDLTNKTLDKLVSVSEQINGAPTGANALVSAPTNLIVQLTNASLTSIDGVAAPAKNEIFILKNRTGASITINNLLGATSAAQIKTGTGANLTLANDASVILAYSTSESKWQVVGGSGGGGGGLSDWITAKPYLVGDIVIQSNRIYKALTAHTSGTFATDLTAVKWVRLDNQADDMIGVTPLLNGGTGNTTGTATINAAMTGEATSNGTTNAVTLTNSAVLNKVLTGFTSGAGSVSSADSLLAAIQKLDGNDGLNLAKSTLTTKGDTFVATGAGVVVRQAVGTNGQVVTADSTQTNGLKWADTSIMTKSQNGASTATTEIQFPNNLVTDTATGKRLVEIDSENLLVNPSFEHSTVTTGWTLGTSNTLTGTTTSAYRFSGAQAGLLSTSATVPFNFYQDVTPVSGLAGTQGEITMALAGPSGAPDLKLCSRINAVTSTTNCKSLIYDNVYREYSLPITFGTSGQSAGLALASTASYASGTVVVPIDKARLKPGLSYTSLMGDTVYSAALTTTSGIIYRTSKPGWITGCTAANPSICTISSSLNLTAALTCTATIDGATAGVSANVVSLSSTQLSVRSYTTSTGVDLASKDVQVVCQKSGSDYASAAGTAYSQAGALVVAGRWNITSGQSIPNNTSTTIAWNNATAIDTVGGMNLSTGVYTVKEPGKYRTHVTVIGPASATGQQCIYIYKGAASTAVVCTNNLATQNTVSTDDTQDFVTGDTISSQYLQSSGSAYAIPNNATYSFMSIERVSGGANVVGSFAGIEKCTTAGECDDTFGAQGSSTGVISGENKDWIQGNAAGTTSPYALTFVTGTFTQTPNCWVSTAASASNAQSVQIGNISASGATVRVYNTTTGAAIDGLFSIHCQKTGADYFPKTAKIATSIGVPTVPGIVGTSTGERIDTFSVTYGATSTTVCATTSTTCAYNDSIGVGATVAKAGSTGNYVLTVPKTYIKLKCNGNVETSGFAFIYNASGMSCANCSTLAFLTNNTSFAAADTLGTINCMGSY